MRPRIRTLKPEFWGDEAVWSLRRDARLTAIALISAADDRGRLEFSAATIRGYAFPRDGLTDHRVQRWIEEVVAVGIARSYEVGAWPYLWLPNFWRHQVINKPTESVLPAHPDDPYGDVPIQDALAQFREDYRSTPGGAPVVLPPSRVGARFRSSSSSVPSSKDKEREGRTSRRVDQDELPGSLPANLHETAFASLVVLEEVQAERGGDKPTVRGVGLAISRFPDRDHARIVRELEHWALAGTGQGRPVKDWARTLATFLERSPAGAPVKVGANGAAPLSARDERRARRLAAMDRLTSGGAA